MRPERLSIHTHTQAPATEAQWLSAIDTSVAAADAAGKDEALKAHHQWWDDFWTRSWVFATGNADAEAATLGYVLQRWISACESFWECTNPTPDIAGLMWDIDRLLALTDRDIGTERRIRWTQLRKVIPAMPMAETF